VNDASVVVDARDADLEGDLTVPPAARGLVLFAHGSGSSRRSPRNRAVAGVLQAVGLATLLFDLLTPGEEAVDLRTRALRFDIELLAERLAAATDWAARQPEVQSLPPAYFGASTGAAAALVAAADRPGVRAIVSRGGRPDLAGDRLPLVQAPTLLIVGSRDETVLDLNRQAADRMRAPVELEIVPGATHLFEEPGALEVVADLARDWILRWI
jgi:putative phosphoribosyl transferase